MAKKIDPKAKAKRQKIIAIAGAVLLVVILVRRAAEHPEAAEPAAHGHGSGVDRADVHVVTPAAGTLAPPTLAGRAPDPDPAAAVAAGVLVSTDAPAAPSTAKLVSFSLFVSKDPFRQQVSPGGAAARRVGSDRLDHDSDHDDSDDARAAEPAAHGDGARRRLPASVVIERQRDLRDRRGREDLPGRRPAAVLPARLGDSDLGEDRDRRRLADERQEHGHDPGRQDGDADEHRGRDEVHDQARLGRLAHRRRGLDPGAASRWLTPGQPALAPPWASTTGRDRQA